MRGSVLLASHPPCEYTILLESEYLTDEETYIFPSGVPLLFKLLLLHGFVSFVFILFLSGRGHLLSLVDE
jgi:hypothetical protein